MLPSARRLASGLLVIVILAGGCATPRPLVQEPAPQVVERDDVLWGDLKGFKRAGRVDLARVFEAYVVERGGPEEMDDREPAYWLLLQQMNAILDGALAKVAVRNVLDVVVNGERATLVDADGGAVLPALDITDEVVEELGSAEEAEPLG
jgi:hypothetical protein